MTRGKQTCRILKEIRRQIAEANDIEFVTSECRYKGDCLGTCPKCDAEVRYLEQQLRARSLAGKAIALAGISAGMIFVSGCSGTSSSNQSTETLQGEPVVPVEQNEITDSIGDESLEDTLQKEETPKLHIIKVTDLAICGDPELLNETDSVKEVSDSTEDNQSDVYEAVGEVGGCPTFPGGDQKLNEWISQHLQYPQNAYDSNIQGRVVVQFLVKEDGSVGDAKIVKSVFPDLDEEAVRVVKTLPKFNPAIINGKPVDYWFTMPITFKLTE